MLSTFSTPLRIHAQAWKFQLTLKGHMDEYAAGPVYGAENKYAKFVGLGIGLTIIAWTLYCVVIAVIFGLEGNYQHFTFVALMIFIDLQLLVAVYFYKKADQEEKKFLVNVVFCIIAVIFVGVVLNVYVWVTLADDNQNKPDPNCDYANCTAGGSVWLIPPGGAGQCISSCAPGQFIPISPPYICTTCGTGTGNCTDGGGGGTGGNGTNSTASLQQLTKFVGPTKYTDLVANSKLLFK